MAIVYFEEDYSFVDRDRNKSKSTRYTGIDVPRGKYSFFLWKQLNYNNM